MLAYLHTCETHAHLHNTHTYVQAHAHRHSRQNPLGNPLDSKSAGISSSCGDLPCPACHYGVTSLSQECVLEGGGEKSQEKEGLEINFRLLDAQPVNDAKEQSFPYTGSLQAG